MDDFLTFEVRSAIFEHMDAADNVEVCGTIEKDGDGYKYVPHENVHPDSGKIDPATGELMDVFKFNEQVSARILSSKSNVIAYVHSHPRGPGYPSVLDQGMQIDIGKPGVIAARNPSNGVLDIFSYGDHLLEVDLMGRLFRHAVLDCYEAIRSYYWQKRGRKLDPFIRPDDWWNTGADMYEENFRSQGFEEFQPDFGQPSSVWHPQEGDIILMQLDSPVINHGAVYIGNNEIYHHRQNKKSGTNALGYLLDNGYVRKWIREKPL